ncbi:aldehyde dehydrogenase family protein [Streptomyces sp. NBC_00878]|uniref:aldehyde dehydrogenase family protein n=1 Tax=Streptomyces sp. NBC_00878 TaxID=2975854 RepID=UPI002256783F|nr:aldehyde dehydrogenase family protein [Streptomyces sp. NBC_00878]MCX4911150.1 aldehyde dehydrogenase family protein [Streptomyces sp. NBC_00878]
MVDTLIGGTWTPADSGAAEEVTSPFDGATVGVVPVAGSKEVEAALVAAEAGAAVRRATPAHERMRTLFRAAELADLRAARTARLISAETGKTITEAAGEAGRSGDIIRLAAGAGVCWDVAPAEVAEQPNVAALRTEYEAGLAERRWFG